MLHETKNRLNHKNATTLVFATACIDLDPPRYQSWINYYTRFFPNVDLLLINDGPVVMKLDLKTVKLITFPERLGRISTNIFPGWKRSFGHALQYARGYKHIAHVESDCWIKLTGRKIFKDFLNKPGYFTGFVKAYNFPESALQIINDKFVLNFYINRYKEKNWYENVNFEADIVQQLKPVYILNGDRYEGFSNRNKPNYTFLSQASGFLKKGKINKNMLSLKQIQDICLVYGSSKKCRYLAQDDSNGLKWYCLKQSGRKKDIDDEVKELIAESIKNNVDLQKQGVPLGDNCIGYPLLKYINQGYDIVVF